MTPTDRKNHAWWIHFGFLAIMAVAFVISAWDALFSPRDKGLHLEALGAILGASFGLVYALVTTLVMLWAARFRWSSLVIHGSAITLFGLSLYAKQQKRQQREAEYQAEHADEIHHDKQRQELRTCLHVELVKVSLGPPLRAEVTLANRDCRFPVVVSDVDLSGFKGGGNWILGVPMETWRTRSRLEVGGRRTFTMEDSMRGDDKLSPEGWSWRSNVNIEEPEDMMPCFVTPGAPATAGCQAIDRVIVEPGP